MTILALPFRRATGGDAVEMAELVNVAGDGLSLYLWGKTAGPGVSPWDFGIERARIGGGGFKHDNTVVREENGKVAACLIGYPLSSSPAPPEGKIADVLMPIHALEQRVVGTWFVNILAVYPLYRRQGIARALMGIGETLAKKSGCSIMSLIASDGNTGGRRFYEKIGYEEADRRPMVKEQWRHSGNNWILYVKGV